MKAASVYALGAALVATALLFAPPSDAERAATVYVPVEARLIRTDVEGRRVHRKRVASEPIAWMPSARFTYEVDGVLHTAHRVRYELRPFEDRVDAEAFLADFTPGSTVTAWVDPDDPTRAVLLVDAAWWFHAPEALLALVAAVLGWVAWAPPTGATSRRDPAGWVRGVTPLGTAPRRRR